MARFKPTRPNKEGAAPRHVLLSVTPEKYAHLQALAKVYGVSLKEFVRQAVDYAVTELDDGQP